MVYIFLFPFYISFFQVLHFLNSFIYNYIIIYNYTFHIYIDNPPHTDQWTKRLGAEEARLAHNQEVGGSKPLVAKFFPYLFEKLNNLFKLPVLATFIFDVGIISFVDFICLTLCFCKISLINIFLNSIADIGLRGWL